MVRIHMLAESLKVLRFSEEYVALRQTLLSALTYKLVIFNNIRADLHF